MNSNFRAGFGSGSTLCGDVGTIRSSIVRALGAVCVCHALAFANLGCGLAFDAGAQEGRVSAPRQSPSKQTLTAPATKAVRGSDSRAQGSMIKIEWKVGKLSLDVDGAPLSEVLQAVSHETGIEVIGADGLSDRVSRHFAEMDLVRVLGDLLSGVDYSMTAAGPPDSASTQATRIVIFGAGVGSGRVTSLVRAKMKEPGVPAADVQADNQAAIEPTPSVAPDGAQEESPVAVTENAVSVAPDAAQQDSQPAVTDAAARAPDADREESPPSVIEAAGTAAPDAAQQERRLAAIEAAAASGDLEALRNNLQDVDPAVQAAAFHALAKQDQVTAVDDLLAGVEDPSQATRLQALQLLAQSSEAGEQTVMTALRDALKDPDPAFIAYAVQALAGRGNNDAMAALTEAFQSADPSTKLMIIDSVANTLAGRPLLSEAVSDSNEAVRSAAATLLKR